MSERFKAYAMNGMVSEGAYRRMVVLQEDTPDESKKDAGFDYLDGKGAILLNESSIQRPMVVEGSSESFLFYLLPEAGSAALVRSAKITGSADPRVTVTLVGKEEKVIDDFVDNMLQEINSNE